MNETIKEEYLKRCINEEKGKEWFKKNELPLDIIISLAKKEVSDYIIKAINTIGGLDFCYIHDFKKELKRKLNTEKPPKTR